MSLQILIIKSEDTVTFALIVGVYEYHLDKLDEEQEVLILVWSIAFTTVVPAVIGVAVAHGLYPAGISLIWKLKPAVDHRLSHTI